jgi:hypothetical protein
MGSSFARLTAFTAALPTLALERLRARDDWPTSATRLRRGTYDVVAGVLVLLAAIVAWNQVHDLSWPCEADQYRDLGAAQSLLDGGRTADPAFGGEQWWYPPLVPAVVALIGYVTTLPLHEVYTRAGTFLNLLSPLAFYAMVATLFGRRTALPSLIGFLFLGPTDLMSWMHATYSPWLWACNLSQAFFYVSILTATLAMTRTSVYWAVLAGLSIGLTSLADPAALLVLGGVLVALVARQTIGNAAGRIRGVIRTGLVIGAVATLLGLPFWGVIIGRYQLRVVNPVPLAWVAGELALDQLGALVARTPSVRFIGALIGIGGLLVTTSRQPGARLSLLGWGLVAGGSLVYDFVRQAMALPPLLPSWHFYFYLQALEAVLFGAGVLVVARSVSGFASARKAGRARQAILARSGEIVVAFLILYVGTRWKEYASRPDLVINREASIASSKRPEIELYHWLLRKARPTDVVLADPGTSFIIAAAGRKVVALPELFSSPYVALHRRARDTEQMLAAIERGDSVAFRRLSARYRVGLVALPASMRGKVGSTKALKRVHTSAKEGGNDVYRVRHFGASR